MTTFSKITLGSLALFAAALPGVAAAQAFGQLQCTPAYQTVGVGQVANFRALGGMGTYHWTSPEHSFLNVGPALNTGFTMVGPQEVRVTSGIETAMCHVNVVPAGSPGQSYPIAPMPGYGQPQPPTLTQLYYPRLPNTGLEPLSGSQAAAAAALLGVVALLAYPYARKAFTAALA